MDYIFGKTSACAMNMRAPGNDSLATWAILVFVDSVSRGHVYSTVSARAVVDDFGNLVAVTPFSS